MTTTGATPPRALPVIPLKPRLRGHLHQWALVTFLVAGSVLIGLAPGGRARFAAAVYAVAACLLYATSALYHRCTWQPAAQAIMKRLDHSMILVLIAGTYTPLALLLLHGATGTVALIVVWSGALLGIMMRMVWLAAPAWAVILPYLLVGWIAAFLLPELMHAGGVATLVLVAGGGLLYTIGAVVYATRRPNPWPSTFGFHEIFHLLTILAGVMMYVAISFAVYS